MILFYLSIIVMYVLNAIAFGRVARLAGLPEIGWMAWVPIANIVQQLLLIRKSGWWIFMYLVPVANLIFAIIWQVKLLNAFGKSGSYILLGIFLGPVYSILWIVWGLSANTRYVGRRDYRAPKSSRSTRAYSDNSYDLNVPDTALFDNDSFDNDSFDNDFDFSD
jgi:hypothetical protein